MQGYNAIVVFNKDEDKILWTHSDAYRNVQKGFVEIIQLNNIVGADIICQSILMKFCGSIICSPKKSPESRFVGFDALRRTVILRYFTACRKRHALRERLKTGIKFASQTLFYYLLSIIHYLILSRQTRICLIVLI